MQKNRKFYVLLTLLCAGALFFLPLCLASSDNPAPVSVTPVSPLPSATEKTNRSPAPATTAVDAITALKKETFTVLHADGKTKSSISCRDFLIFTLAAEMLPSFEPEALKAQAVAAYTYFSYEREQERKNPQKALCGADFADTPAPFPEGYRPAYWEKKWGTDAFKTYYKKLASAVDAVAGETITYKGKLILAAYHAISPGKTEVAESVWASAVPYLQSVDSTDDEKAPDFTTTVRLTPVQVQKALADKKEIRLSGEPNTWFSAKPTRSAAGTVLKQPIANSSLSGKECRTLFGLRSACFSVAYENGCFVFTVKGYGHGVGMSQYGAQFAALNGASYKEILHRYYTGVDIG